MRPRPYPSYKASGIDWLGDVPRHWAVQRLKYSASINDETLPESTSPDYELAYVDIGNVDTSSGISEVELMVFEGAPSRPGELFVMVTQSCPRCAPIFVQ